jgi:hypothetical protein
MSKKSLGTRALQVASSVATCTFAIASQADPISLTGSCHLSNTITGQGRCDITYSLSDSFTTPSTVRRGQIKVNGKLVAEFVNDDVHPIDFAIPLVSGGTTVLCGGSYKIRAYIAPVGVDTPYVQVGSLPPFTCPPAP